MININSMMISFSIPYQCFYLLIVFLLSSCLLLFGTFLGCLLICCLLVTFSSSLFLVLILRLLHRECFCLYDYCHHPSHQDLLYYRRLRPSKLLFHFHQMVLDFGSYSSCIFLNLKRLYFRLAQQRLP